MADEHDWSPTNQGYLSLEETPELLAAFEAMASSAKPGPGELAGPEWARKVLCAACDAALDRYWAAGGMAFKPTAE